MAEGDEEEEVEGEGSKEGAVEGSDKRGEVRAVRGCMAMKSSSVRLSLRREAGMAAGRSVDTENERVDGKELTGQR